MASFFKGEKILNIDEKLAEKQTNRQNEHTRQNTPTGICLFSNVNQRHSINICSMKVKGSLGIEWLNRLMMKGLNNNPKMLVGATRNDLSSAA